jgi:hypothetical protein
VQHLRDINLQFFSWQGAPMQTNERSDGVSQVYFKDLDGYWIEEVNDRRAVWGTALLNSDKPASGCRN